jgi:GGDEF domain-containing protein
MSQAEHTGSIIAGSRQDLEARLRGEVNRGFRYFREFSVICLRPDEAEAAVDLVELANLLRPSDTIGEVEPGEYCIVAVESPLDLARRIAERILYHYVGRSPAPLSLGVAGFESVEDTAETILGRARTAQAFALAHGGNQVAALSRKGTITVSDFRLTP